MASLPNDQGATAAATAAAAPAAAGVAPSPLADKSQHAAISPVRDSDSNTEDEGRNSASATPRISETDTAREPANITSPPDGDVEKGLAASQKGVSSKDGAEADPNIVWWDEKDPEHPHHWPRWKTLTNVGLISVMTFLTPLASSIFAPGVPQLMAEFESSSLELAAFVVSVYLLGFAFGPLILAPLSELYGRTYVYHVSNVGFIAFVCGCALAPSLNALIAFRFLSGIFGSCPVTNGGGSISDMVPQEKRGAAMAGFSIGPLLGPVIGPIIGGFLAQSKGWRWNFWLLAIVTGAVTIVMVFTLRETYHPVLLQRKVDRLKKETGNQELRSKLDPGMAPADYFKRSIVRPLKLIAFSPIVMILSLYIALTYGYLYIMFTSITEIFEQYYGFSTNLVGLAFLGIGVGSLVGIAIFSGTSDKYIQRKAAQADAEAEKAGRAKEGMKPEYRLPTLVLGAVFMPAGLFIYGWTAQYRVHWIAPIIGTALIGAGNLIIIMALQLYLIDAFSIYAASAVAANTVVRSVAGAVLPLAGLKLYDRLGMGWGNSLLGFISLLLVPVAFLIIRYGEYIRKRFEVKNL